MPRAIVKQAKRYLLSMESVECTEAGFTLQQRLNRLCDAMHARGYGKRSFI
jgi:hypothetical protein